MRIGIKHIFLGINLMFMLLSVCYLGITMGFGFRFVGYPAKYMFLLFNREGERRKKSDRSKGNCNKSSQWNFTSESEDEIVFKIGGPFNFVFLLLLITWPVCFVLVN
jgi:hypothetical protein